MSNATKVLSPEEVNHFINHGYVTVHDCFSRETAQAITDRAFQRLGYDKDDRNTWAAPRIHMPSLEYYDLPEFSPRAWEAICQLLGGVERIKLPATWSDALIANFHEGADQPWRAPSAECPGWHKDGDFFRHFLDSPEQGLLTLVVWSDIKHKGGGTYIAPDSIKVVTGYLKDRTDGVKPNEFPFKAMIHDCKEFIEFTGNVGDVVLLHPYMLHTVSQNHSDVARFITNPPVSLKEPMQFNRENLADFSPVELAVLNALGVERFDYQPTHERERIVPERVLREQKMIEEQKARLAGIAG
jgi:hypothetical protein